MTLTDGEVTQDEWEGTGWGPVGRGRDEWDQRCGDREAGARCWFGFLY